MVFGTHRFFTTDTEKVPQKKEMFEKPLVEKKLRIAKIADEFSKQMRGVYRHTGESLDEVEIGKRQAELVGFRTRLEQLYDKLPFLTPKEIEQQFRNLLQFDLELAFIQEKGAKLASLGPVHKEALELLSKTGEVCRGLANQKEIQARLQNFEKALSEATSQIKEQCQALKTVTDSFVLHAVQRIHLLTLEHFFSSVRTIYQNVDSSEKQSAKTKIFKLLQESWPEEVFPIVDAPKEKSVELSLEFLARCVGVKLEKEFRFRDGGWLDGIAELFVKYTDKPTHAFEEQLEAFAKQLQLLQTDVLDAELNPVQRPITFKETLQGIRQELKQARLTHSQSKERAFLFYTLHLEMIADDLELKIDEFLKRSKERRVATVQEGIFKYLKAVCEKEKPVAVDVKPEITALYDALEPFAALDPAKKSSFEIENRKYKLFLKILNVLGQKSLKRAQDCTRNVFPAVLARQIDYVQAEEIVCYLQAGLLKRIYRSSSQKSGPGFALALETFTKHFPVNLQELRQSEKSLNAFLNQIPPIQNSYSDPIKEILQDLSICLHRKEKFFNGVRYAKSACLNHELSFDPFVEKMLNRVRKNSEFPKFDPDLGPITLKNKEDPSWLLSLFANALWGVGEQKKVAQEMVTITLEETSPDTIWDPTVWSLLAYYLLSLEHERSQKETQLLDKVLVEYLQQEPTKNEIRTLFGTGFSEELLYMRASRSKELQDKCKEALGNTYDSFMKSMKLYSEYRSDRTTDSRMLEQLKSLLNSEYYATFQTCCKEFNLLSS